MEMVLISDIHIGRYKYGRMNEDGYDTRTFDILENIQQALDYSFKNNIKNVLILGDFYHTKRPAQVFRRLLSIRLGWALEHGVKLYLLLGNHDQGKSHGHDLVEFVELSHQIDNLIVVEEPIAIETEDSILCFMPHPNVFDLNISSQDFYDYVIRSVNKLSTTAKESKAKYKYFFGHYATDKSIAGKSFDMGMDEKCNRVLPLSIFDSSIWTKVFLGDIHKPQELNSFCRHVGSIAKVDFGEEGEKKGFYIVNGNTDKFIEIKDREFKTLFVDLSKTPRDQMREFCESVQEEDLSKSIVRLKAVIKESDKNCISFTGIEDYLKQECWNYIGKNIQEIREDKQEIKIEHNEELNYVSMFRSFLEQSKVELKDEVLKTGENVLANLMNS
jgi:exonuclease SbcD